jgi:hypothetical protein
MQNIKQIENHFKYHSKCDLTNKSLVQNVTQNYNFESNIESNIEKNRVETFLNFDQIEINLEHPGTRNSSIVIGGSKSPKSRGF